MTVDILGTGYKVSYVNYADDPTFEKNNWSGYCDEYTKEIAICDLQTHPAWANDPQGTREKAMNLALRHEIIHAFLNESGLSADSFSPNCGWAKNEEMVDFFAIQFPKIQKVFNDLSLI